MKSIRLHKEHGLNPTIPNCYVCGKQKNEIALLGAAYKEKAPMGGLVIDKTPCDECKELMKQGVILISVKDGESGDDPYRTGKFVVLKLDAAKRVFKNFDENHRICFVEDCAMKQIVPQLYEEE